jgi:hypothetical protein
MKKITKFSDGTIDYYRGKRDVQAGWMITFPDGDRMTGHSLDQARARKTAENTIGQCAPIGHRVPSRNRLDASSAGYWMGEALEAGFSPAHPRAAVKMLRDNAARIRAEFATKCTIEIVQVEEV